MDTMTNPELTEQENASATLTSDSTQVQADPAPQVESDTQTDTASHPEAASPTEQPESPPETGQPKQAQAKRTAAAKKRRRMAAQRMRLHNVLLAGVFLLILLVFAFINLIVKDKDFSEAENRNLSQKPALTVAAIKDGSYFSGLSDYASDQFFARDGWMSLKLKAETIMGRKDASGIFLGKDDYLLSAPETPDDEALSRTIQNINQFAEDHTELSTRVMLVPDSAMILTDKLPKNAPVRDQLLDISNVAGQLSGSIQFLNAAEALSPHADEYIYYKTDHHWTSLGAYYAFTAFTGQMGIASPASSYDIYTVTDSFEGTLSSKSGSHKTTDTIQIYEAKQQDSYYVTYSDSTDRVCSIYKSAALETKDKYTVFFGGNHPKVEINTTADNERVLLLFKDSYANSFVQFLLPYYQKIIMIDPRYYYDNLDTILTSEGVTDVLFLYSADTFLKDTSLSDVLEATGQEQEGSLVGSDDPEGTQQPGSAEDSSELESSVGSSAESTPETSPESSPDSSEESSPDASPDTGTTP